MSPPRSREDPVEPNADGAVLERVIFFSDAVFAIAITLLTLDLRLPDLADKSEHALFLALLNAVPALAAYALSFAVVAAFWIGHIRTFRAVVRTTPVLIALDLLLLAFIALLPFPTSVLARDGNLATAALFYALFGLATASLSTLLWVYAAYVGRVVGSWVTPQVARFTTYRAATAPIVFAVSIPVVLVFGAFPAEAMWYSLSRSRRSSRAGSASNGRPSWRAAG
jgi:uncharacterized membrane protein